MANQAKYAIEIGEVSLTILSSAKSSNWLSESLVSYNSKTVIMKNVCKPPLLELSGLRKARVLGLEDDLAIIRKGISWNGREFRVKVKILA